MSKSRLSKYVVLVITKNESGTLEFEYGSDVSRQPSKETLEKLKEIAQKTVIEVWEKSTIKKVHLTIDVKYY